MSYLFYFNERENIVLRPECVKLSPELSLLDKDELTFIILVYDYHSIYRQWPEADRIRKAMMYVWNDNNPKILESRKVNAAIQAYKALQFNPKEEQIRRYQQKIIQMMDVIESEKSVTAIKNAREIIAGLKKDILELENEIAEGVRQEGEIKGGGKLSWLEDKMNNNKELYLKIMEGKK